MPIWAIYASPWCSNWDGVGGRGALSGSCVGQDGWVGEERAREREGIVSVIKAGGFIFMLEER